MARGGLDGKRTSDNSVAGILGGVAAVIVALTGLYVAVKPTAPPNNQVKAPTNPKVQAPTKSDDDSQRTGPQPPATVQPKSELIPVQPKPRVIPVQPHVEAEKPVVPAIFDVTGYWSGTSSKWHHLWLIHIMKADPDGVVGTVTNPRCDLANGRPITMEMSNATWNGKSLRFDFWFPPVDSSVYTGVTNRATKGTMRLQKLDGTLDGTYQANELEDIAFTHRKQECPNI